MSSHPLDPLLNPHSLAIVGASPKKNSPGHILTKHILNMGYQGKSYLINPGYTDIDGETCYSELAILPETVDHVVLAVGNERLEKALTEAIAHGSKAATIYSSCFLEEDTDPPLRQRLVEMAREANIAICGGNGMGFYNPVTDLYVGIYPLPGNVRRGGISYIAQSGSAFSALSHNGTRLRFNLCVSSGNEMVTTVADYMDWSLEQPETTVIGLFLEAVRDPTTFIAALEKAVTRQIPVVVLKIGKSPLSAKMALTHTGAIAGDHAAYEALFKKYGVIEVDGFDEMSAVLMMLQSPKKIRQGALATIQESGGFRELVTDVAHELSVPFAEIEKETKDQIQEQLEPGLVAENPLDAWGSNDDFENRFCLSMQALMNDPNVAVGIFFTNFRDGYYLSEAFFRLMKEINKTCDKPIAMANCYSDLANTSICQRASDLEIPVIDGTKEALMAIKHLFKYRDFQSSINDKQTSVTNKDLPVKKWRDKLICFNEETLSEADAMTLLSDFGIPVPSIANIDNEQDLIQKAEQIGFPLVLKTAMPDIHHKSDAGGVVVNVKNSQQLLQHYQDMNNRLGPSAILCEMINKGTEVGLGMINDPQFGPFIMVTAGGVMIELMPERAVAMAPVSDEEADQLLTPLAIDKMIQGIRGLPEGDRESLVRIIVAFSIMADELKDHIKEIDINPVIVTPSGATAADALVALN